MGDGSLRKMFVPCTTLEAMSALLSLRTELLFPRGRSCAASTHPLWAASSALGMTVCAGNKGAQGSQDLHLPPGKLSIPTTHILREMCLSVTLQMTRSG